MVDIKIVENQTEENCQFVIDKRPALFKYIINPSEKVKEIAIKRDPFNIQYIENPSEELCILAVKENSSTLNFIEIQTEDIILNALKTNPACFKYAKIQNEKIIEAALHCYKSAWNFYYINNPTVEHAKMAMKLNGAVFNIIPKNLKTDDFYRFCLNLDIETQLWYIILNSWKNKTDDDIRCFIKNHILALRYIKKQTIQDHLLVFCLDYEKYFHYFSKTDFAKHIKDIDFKEPIYCEIVKAINFNGSNINKLDSNIVEDNFFQDCILSSANDEAIIRLLRRLPLEKSLDLKNTYKFSINTSNRLVQSDKKLQELVKTLWLKGDGGYLSLDNNFGIKSQEVYEALIKNVQLRCDFTVYIKDFTIDQLLELANISNNSLLLQDILNSITSKNKDGKKFFESNVINIARKCIIKIFKLNGYYFNSELISLAFSEKEILDIVKDDINFIKYVPDYIFKYVDIDLMKKIISAQINCFDIFYKNKSDTIKEVELENFESWAIENKYFNIVKYISKKNAYKIDLNTCFNIIEYDSRLIEYLDQSNKSLCFKAVSLNPHAFSNIAEEYQSDELITFALSHNQGLVYYIKNDEKKAYYKKFIETQLQSNNQNTILDNNVYNTHLEEIDVIKLLKKGHSLKDFEKKYLTYDVCKTAVYNICTDEIKYTPYDFIDLWVYAISVKPEYVKYYKGKKFAKELLEEARDLGFCENDTIDDPCDKSEDFNKIIDYIIKYEDVDTYPMIYLKYLPIETIENIIFKKHSIEKLKEILNNIDYDLEKIQLEKLHNINIDVLKSILSIHYFENIQNEVDNRGENSKTYEEVFNEDPINNIDFFKKIENPSTNIILKAISIDPFQIRYINNPTREMCIKVIMADPRSYNAINNPSDFITKFYQARIKK